MRQCSKETADMTASSYGFQCRYETEQSAAPGKSPERREEIDSTWPADWK